MNRTELPFNVVPIELFRRGAAPNPIRACAELTPTPFGVVVESSHPVPVRACRPTRAVFQDDSASSKLQGFDDLTFFRCGGQENYLTIQPHPATWM